MIISRCALLAAATVPGIALAVAVAGSPSQAATPTAVSSTTTSVSANPTTTTRNKAPTSTSTSKWRSSSTKCRTGTWSSTSYTDGQRIAEYRFETGGVPSAFSGSSGLSVVDDPSGVSGGALSVPNVSSKNPLYLSVNTQGWGPFQLTARVLTDNGLPAELNVTVGSLAEQVTSVALDPNTFLDITGYFDAGVLHADWICNGKWTGHSYPRPVQLEFSVRTACEGVQPARTILLDDVVITRTDKTTRAKGTTPETTSEKPTCPAVSTSSKSSKTKSLKCKVSLSSVNSWPNGWSATLQIANTSTVDAGPWTLTATVPSGETLTLGWPGTFTQSGTTLTGTPLSFQETLKAKSKVNWGLVLAGGTQAPTGWAINGTACAVS